MIRSLKSARRHAVGRRATRAAPVSESLERRTLLSAGDYDPTFSGDGKLLVADAVYTRTGTDVAVQADGKVLVVGSRYQDLGFGSQSGLLLTRYNPDGTLDTTFGTGGSVVASPNATGGGVAVKVTPDGNIVVGAAGLNASGDAGWAAVRFLPNGAPDPSFGNGGATFLNLPAAAYRGLADLDLAPDGKVVLAGATAAAEFTVARLTAAGRLDTTFGGDGIAHADFDPARDDELNGVAVLDDGRVVVAGTTFSRPDRVSYVEAVVARFTESGTLDTTFDVDGWAATATRTGQGTAVVVDASDRVYVSGRNASGPSVWRLTPSGTTDRTFGGGDGIANIPPAPQSAYIFYDLFPAPGGKMLAAGFAGATLTQGQNMLVARFTPDGAPDPTFNATGSLVVDFYGQDDLAAGVAAAPGGRVVAAGQATTGEYLPYEFVGQAVVRFNDDGSPDTTFGPGGKAPVVFEGARRSINSVVVQPDRKIVVGGSTVTGPRIDFFVARYNPDGTLDATFERDGRAVTDFGNGRVDGVTRVLLQPDGKVVAAGASSLTGGGLDIALARYNPDGSLDTTFGQGGKVLTNFAQRGQTADAALYPGGRIVVAGEYRVVRFTPSGGLDTTFAGDGSLELNVTGGTVESVLVQGDKLLVERDVRVERYNADGSRDLTFASPELQPGIETGDDGDEEAYSRITRMRLAPDGVVVVLGHMHDHDDEREKVILWRLNPDGALDTAWGQGGRVTTFQYDATDLYETDALVQPDGKIVVTANGEDFDYEGRVGVVFRFEPDGTPDEMFGVDGVARVRNEPELRAVALDPTGDVVAGGTLVYPRTGWGVVRIDGTGTEGSARHDRSSGTVTVLGEVGDDHITVNVSRGRVFVNFNGTPWSFPVTSVRRVLVYGRLGNDRIRAATSVPGLEISGGSGDDVLIGGSGGEWLRGGEGHDTIDGGLGHDTLDGGPGTDTLDYRSRTQPVFIRPFYPSGEAGENDVIRDGFERNYGGSGNDDILLSSNIPGAAYGGDGNDTLTGSHGADALWGEGGDDVLFNSFGADYFRGGAGSDTVSYANSYPIDVTIDGNPNDGQAAIYIGGPGEGDNVNTDVENVIGSDYDDRIVGSAANNRLEGGTGDDTLIGLAGDDTLVGGEGDDTLTDTQGANTLDGGNGTDTVNGVTESRTPMTLQAEDATLVGARPGNLNFGYTGTGYADFANPSGDHVEWTYNAVDTGRRVLTFRYANGALSDRPLELKVNDVVVYPRLSFESTGSWSTWRSVQVEVNILPGVNRIRLTSVGNNGANIDSLIVS